MYARQFAARLLALAAIVGSGAARVQPTESIFVDVAPDSAEFGEVERRYTGELMQELNSVSADALLLFTEYTGWAGADLKSFLRNISSLTQETLAAIDPRVLDHAPSSCRKKLDSHLKKIEYDAHRAGSFNGKTHHKFLLGHMIVFKMHLNKSEDYVKKCYKIIEDCGVHCENTPRMIRWRRLALEEISRVRDDIEHSRRSYRDLLLHSRRRLRRIRQQADTRANVAATEFRNCVSGKTTNHTN